MGVPKGMMWVRCPCLIAATIFPHRRHFSMMKAAKNPEVRQSWKNWAGSWMTHVYSASSDQLEADASQSRSMNWSQLIYWYHRKERKDTRVDSSFVMGCEHTVYQATREFFEVETYIIHVDRLFFPPLSFPFFFRVDIIVPDRRGFYGYIKCYIQCLWLWLGRGDNLSTKRILLIRVETTEAKAKCEISNRSLEIINCSKKWSSLMIL